MKAQLTGTAELKRALAEFGINADKQLANIVRGTAQGVRLNAIKSIQRGPKTGRSYKRGKKTHIASAPGQPPANDFGGLANAIEADIKGKNAVVGIRGGKKTKPTNEKKKSVTIEDYAIALEFGTQKMAARPFLFPALEKERPAWNRRLDKIVDQAAKGIIK